MNEQHSTQRRRRVAPVILVAGGIIITLGVAFLTAFIVGALRESVAVAIIGVGCFLLLGLLALFPVLPPKGPSAATTAQRRQRSGRITVRVGIALSIGGVTAFPFSNAPLPAVIPGYLLMLGIGGILGGSLVSAQASRRINRETPR